MISKEGFTTTKTPCNSFSGSIIKCAISLDVICPDTPCNVTTACKRAEVMLCFFYDTAAKVKFHSRLAGSEEWSLTVPLSSVWLMPEHMCPLFMLWNKEGNILQRGRRKFTTPPWQKWAHSSTQSHFIRLCETLFHCFPSHHDVHTCCYYSYLLTDGFTGCHS